jgi:HlyD family secretion protein
VKRLAWIILGILIIGAAISAFVFRGQLLALITSTNHSGTNGGESDTDDSSADNDSGESIWALGRLEPAGGVINVSATPGDQLLELHVAEGETIDPKKILGRLQSNILRDNEVEQLTSQLSEAKEKLETERLAAANKLDAAKLAEEQAAAVSSRELEAQRAKLQALRIAVTQAGKEFDRLTALKAEASDLVSQQQLEQAQLAKERATAEFEAAEAGVSSATIASDYQQRLAQQQREASQRTLEQVDKASPIGSLELRLAAAKQQLERSKLRSPISGTALKIFTHSGETVTQRPILQVADLNKMVCIAEVSHDQVQRIVVGQQARIRSRVFGNNEQDFLTGTVASKSLVAATPELREIDPFAAADRHVMEVRIELNEESSRIAAGFVHLQVDVEFLMRGASETP